MNQIEKFHYFNREGKLELLKLWILLEKCELDKKS